MREVIEAAMRTRDWQPDEVSSARMPRQNATLKKAPAAAKQARGALTRASLSADNRAPLYHQIYELLRKKILDGEYARGSCLPGERELGEIFGVSRITTVRALNELAANGLVIRSRGKGTLVQFVDTGTVIRGPTEVEDASAQEAPVAVTDSDAPDSPESGSFPEILERHRQRGAAVTGGPAGCGGRLEAPTR
jgi:DNA-binding transcriptional regulator YhcF (GntR family)